MSKILILVNIGLALINLGMFVLFGHWISLAVVLFIVGITVGTHIALWRRMR